MRHVLTNCNIFTSEETLSGHSLVISAGKVLDIINDKHIKKTDQTFNLQGGLLAPGFIDIQVNGGGGVLFNDNPSIESIATIGKTHRKYGTTSFLPTLISDDHNKMQQAIGASVQALENELPGFIGIHLEGPYLSKVRKGIHCETKIQPPNQESLSLLNALANIGTSMVTLAPEVVPPGFIKQLSESGIKVSIGHSNANYECIKQSLVEGASCFTHLFNAMSPLTSREPGVVGAALDDKESWCGVIVDNFHIHPVTLKIAIKAKQNGKVMLVTDAVHTVGALGTQFNISGTNIFRENGKVTSADGVLAGSDLDMATAVRNCVNYLEIDLEEALRMASLYPAQFLNRNHQLGRIQPGYQADLVLLDEHLHVKETWIKGQASNPL